MTYYKLHNAIKRAGYPKGTYQMWEGGYSFAELQFNNENGIESYPPGVRSYGCIVVPDLNDLNDKLHAAGIASWIYTVPQKFAKKMVRVGLGCYISARHIRVPLS